mmetsp:Transcript_28687/g.80764  ORF Transcript_28687/g.80764 Transcript_28687/m.80764 type:complete len:142 (-) Transcript_28687:310-735(-)|eukprot:CAMPEP_0117670164 /NCGR_PEP_ID=MMETSP0804-20121206/12581_1 /TAXON_ID=1074897 /ORGANISM="Tetraselmis astigmatica, Strain CCMP880" /LENGTH=141 /DNA_ID=CAMNT_0005478393 /DNA_START=293 /DNA_END=718 /DNA_ORIENTATION=-
MGLSSSKDHGPAHHSHEYLGGMLPKQEVPASSPPAAHKSLPDGHNTAHSYMLAAVEHKPIPASNTDHHDESQQPQADGENAEVVAPRQASLTKISAKHHHEYLAGLFPKNSIEMEKSSAHSPGERHSHSYLMAIAPKNPAH